MAAAERKGAPRPAESGRLEQEAQHHESNVDPGHEDQELILGHTALLREVADTERGDQDVEHKHDRVEHRNEQPSVNAESISREGTEAVPGKPEGDQKGQGGGAGDPIL